MTKTVTAGYPVGRGDGVASGVRDAVPDPTAELPPPAGRGRQLWTSRTGIRDPIPVICRHRWGGTRS